jgi:hypothetical protein
MQIPKRKKPWLGPAASWFCCDRVEHYLKLRTVDLDQAAFLTIGMLPEVWNLPFTVMWFDGPFLSSDKEGWKGDDSDTQWGFMEDVKAQWRSAGGAENGIDLRAFLQWVEATFERPHWIDCEGVSEMLHAAPSASAPSAKLPESDVARPSPERTKAILFPRKYLTFQELRVRWNCSELDIRDAVVREFLKPSIKVGDPPMSWVDWEYDDDAEVMLPVGPMLDVQGLSVTLCGDELLYLQFPKQTSPFDCRFRIATQDREFPWPELGGSDTLSFWLPEEMSMVDVERDAVFLEEEIDRFEKEHSTSNSTTVGSAAIESKAVVDGLEPVPSFPQMQGEWYEFQRIDLERIHRVLKLQSAIEFALGLVPGRTPLRWLNNQLVTEPSPGFLSHRWVNDRLVTEFAPGSQSQKISFWSRKLEAAWRERGQIGEDVDAVVFLDWVTQTFVQPEWLARAVALGAWPPKEATTSVTPIESEVHEWNADKFGALARPDAIRKRLDHWLRYDTWSHDQALLILMGLDPEGTHLSSGNFSWLGFGNSVHFLNGTALVDGNGFVGETLQVQMDGTAYKVTHSGVEEYVNQLNAQVMGMRDILDSGAHPDRSHFSYYLRWARSKCFDVNPVVAQYLALTASDQSDDSPTGDVLVPVSRSRAQEEAILKAIRDEGSEPKALPPFKRGRPWVKSRVWSVVAPMTQVFVSKGVFDDAWERLRSSGEIKEAGLPP